MEKQVNLLFAAVMEEGRFFSCIQVGVHIGTVMGFPVYLCIGLQLGH